MNTLSPRRIWLASIPAALVLGGAAIHAQVAAAGAPAGGVIRAMPTAVPADRIHLNTDQVRLLLAAHHPAIVDGLSDDNTVTIILASNGSYLASGASKSVMPSAAAGARSGGGGAGGMIVAAGGGGSGAGSGGGGAVASGGTGGVGGFVARGTAGSATASAAPASAGEVRKIGQMTFPGIGTIDADIVHDMFWTTYEGGELVANPVRVRFVVLVPNAVIK